MGKLPKDVIDITGKTTDTTLDAKDVKAINQAISAGDLTQSVLSELMHAAPGLISLQVKSITQTLESAKQGQANQAQVIDQLQATSTQALDLLETMAQSTQDPEVKLHVVKAIATIQERQLQVLQEVNRDNNLTVREVVKALVGVAAMAGGIGMATKYLIKGK